jgi:hypothetical protein
MKILIYPSQTQIHLNMAESMGLETFDQQILKGRSIFFLAKIVRSKEVCPDIQIDKLPTKLYRLLLQFDRRKPAPINPSQQIKSYMLNQEAPCRFDGVIH